MRATYSDPEIPMPALTVIDPNASTAPVESNIVEPVKDSPQTKEVVEKSAIEPMSLLLAVIAAGLGVIGITGAILMQKRHL